MGALETVQRRRLSLEEFHRMGAAGILREDDRIELIDGEMIQMAPIGASHASIVSRLTRMLNFAAIGKAIVWTQNPIVLPPFSEPLPDVVLLKPHDDDYQTTLPTAADVLLAIEVADTTLRYDRDIKLPLYARHGIPEVWLFDLQARSLSVHREPEQSGYCRVLTPRQDETVTPVLLADVKFDLKEVWR